MLKSVRAPTDPVLTQPGLGTTTTTITTITQTGGDWSSSLFDACGDKTTCTGPKLKSQSHPNCFKWSTSQKKLLLLTQVFWELWCRAVWTWVWPTSLANVCACPYYQDPPLPWESGSGRGTRSRWVGQKPVGPGEAAAICYWMRSWVCPSRAACARTGPLCTAVTLWLCVRW